MPFQRDGIKFAIEKNGRCLIADEMGLGKTLQALSVAFYYEDEWPLLIIVPSSLRYPWVEEFEKWLPQIHPHDINLIQNGGDIHEIGKSKVTIVTYGLLRHPGSKLVREALMNQRFKVTIADESHYIKNRKAAGTKYIVPLIQQSERRILLTGTPALARPEELYPQLEAVNPKMFKNWSEYARRYCDAREQWIGRQRRWVTDGASNLEELQYRLSSEVMIRRLKMNVLTQLPPKQRQRVPFELKESTFKKKMDETWCEMEKLMDLKRISMAHVVKAVNQPAVSDRSGDDFFRLRQMVGELYRHTCKAKIGPVKEYMKMLTANYGLKFLVFAYHHDMMDGVMEELHDNSVTFIRIDGATPPSDRPRLVKQFQSDPQTRVAILSIKAAGVGITLTAANLVVFAELHWTPGELEQCEDRAHRIGQSCTVHVHYLVAKGTLDEWLWSALCKKTTIITTTLNGKRQTLQMEQGNRGQIDCLSNAEAWQPTGRNPEDIIGFFQSQKNDNQRSLLEFFTPSPKQGKRKRNAASPRGEKETQKSFKIVKTSTTDNSSEEEAHISDGSDYSDETGHIVIASKSQSKSKPGKTRVAKVDPVIVLDGSDDESEFKSPRFVPRVNNHLSVHDSPDKHDAEVEGFINMENSTDGETKPKISSQDQRDTSIFSQVVRVRKKRKSDQGKSQRPALNSAGKKWGCGWCTFLNHMLVDKCEMCAHPKGSKLEDSTTRSGALERQVELGLSIPQNACRRTLEEEPKLEVLEENIVDVPKKKFHISKQNSLESTTATDESDSSVSKTLENDTNLTKKSDDLTSLPLADSLVMLGYTPRNGKSATQKLDQHDSIMSQLCGKAKFFHDPRTHGENFATFCDSSSTCSSKSEILKSAEEEELCLPSLSYKSRRKVRETQMRNKGSELHCKNSGTKQVNLDVEVDVNNKHDGDILSSKQEHSETLDGLMVKATDHLKNNEILNYDSPDLFAETESESENMWKSAVPSDKLSETGSENVVIDETSFTDTDSHQIDMTSPVDNSEHIVGDSGPEDLTPGAKNVQNAQSKLGDCDNTISGANDNENPNSKTVGEAKSVTPGKWFTTPGKCQKVSSANIADDVIAAESDAAKVLFSPRIIKASSLAQDHRWRCAECGTLNCMEDEDCDGCFKPRPEELTIQGFEDDNFDQEMGVTELDPSPQENQQAVPEEREVNLDEITVHKKMYFCCSKNTSRIYLFDEEKHSLNVNFTPLDVELENYADLPEILLHPGNFKLVKRFVREWNSVGATKQRILVRSGEIFLNPCILYEELKTQKKTSQRYKSKTDVAMSSIKAAEATGGSVRVIMKPPPPKKKKVAKDAAASGETVHNAANLVNMDVDKMKGLVQAVDTDGCPLCLQCQTPFRSHLVTDNSVQENAWQTRFCSRPCSELFWVKTHREYGQQKVFELEHGICQLCGYDAQAFFQRLRITPDLTKRAKLVKESKYNVLKPEVKEKMVTKPYKGLFWQVDHITPVVDGGGQCDLDNLRTLCTICHKDITKTQNRNRARQRRHLENSRMGDITAFFEKT